MEVFEHLGSYIFVSFSDISKGRLTKSIIEDIIGVGNCTLFPRMNYADKDSAISQICGSYTMRL